MFNLSTATRPVIGSTLFSALQQLSARIGAGVHRITSGKTGAVASATPAASKPATLGFFERIAANAERREIARREAYLAGATDIYDLEYRIAYMDRETRSNAYWAAGNSSY